MSHINFEAIDCPHLCYEEKGRTWVCLKYFDDLTHADTCVQCQFQAKLELERRLKSAFERRIRNSTWGLTNA